MSKQHYKETKAHTTPPVFPVQYAGQTFIQSGPNYGDPDILDADIVGEDLSESNGYFIALAYNNHQELVTRLYDLKNAVESANAEMVILRLAQSSETLKKLGI